MYSVKFYYKITLMHLLTIVIFAHSVKIQRTFFIAIPSTQKKQRPGSNPDDIKTAVFCRNEKVRIVKRFVFTTTLNK